MANFDIILFIIARKICLIRVKSAGHCTVSAANLLQRRPGNVRCTAGHQPMISYTDAGRRPYDM